MKHFVTRIGNAVAGAFGRRTRVLQDFPLDLLAQRKEVWVALLRDAMQRSGRGFRHWTLKRQPPKGASGWRGERRPDKIAAAKRNAANPVFTGKLNYRRSDVLQ